MRIIAGSLRGRKLEAPPGLITRPVTDRFKETLFNILGARLGEPGTLPALDVLDLFAGSGGLGLEAISRGAASCLFVERDRMAFKTLRQNLQTLGVRERCRAVLENAWTMRIPPAPQGRYGLVFVDPPYKDAAVVPLLALLERLAPQVAPGGVVVFRHDYRTRLPADGLPALPCVDERELGTMRLWLFERPPAPEAQAEAAAPDAQPPA